MVTEWFQRIFPSRWFVRYKSGRRSLRPLKFAKERLSRYFPISRQSNIVFGGLWATVPKFSTLHLSQQPVYVSDRYSVERPLIREQTQCLRMAHTNKLLWISPLPVYLRAAERHHINMSRDHAEQYVTAYPEYRPKRLQAELTCV